MKTKIIKLIGISIIMLIVWWGIWGHSITSNNSDYWLKENDQGCAPTYPLIALSIVVGSFTFMAITNRKS